MKTIDERLKALEANSHEQITRAVCPECCALVPDTWAAVNRHQRWHQRIESVAIMASGDLEVPSARPAPDGDHQAGPMVERARWSSADSAVEHPTLFEVTP